MALYKSLLDYGKTQAIKEMAYHFYKKKETDQIWWVDDPKTKGIIRFSFDKKQIFYLYRDYPYKLSPLQRRIFDEENPFWKKFFEGR